MNISLGDVFVRELFFPTLVALFAGLMSYFATYALGEKKQRDERNALIINLLDNLLLQFSNLVPILDRLCSDVDRVQFFTIANINSGIKVTNTLSNYLWNLAFIENQELRIRK
mgnify:FL=1